MAKIAMAVGLARSGRWRPFAPRPRGIAQSSLPLDEPLSQESLLLESLVDALSQESSLLGSAAPSVDAQPSLASSAVEDEESPPQLASPSPSEVALVLEPSQLASMVTPEAGDGSIGRSSSFAPPRVAPPELG